MTSPSEKYTTEQFHHDDEISREIQKVDVAIVGAGISGLQCASSLLSTSLSRRQQDHPLLSLMILEGRDRLGGRIYTTQETRKRIRRILPSLPEDDYHQDTEEQQQHQQEDDEEQEEEVTFPLDHGASWVHGTEGNPMMNLLLLHHQQQQQQRQQQASFSSSSTSTTTTTMPPVKFLLNEIFPNGNPWLRPNHVLHERNQIRLYMNSRRSRIIPNDSILVKDALQYHYYNIMKQVNDHVNHMYDIGDGMKTISTSLQQVVAEIENTNNSNNGNDGKNDDENDVKLVASFYRYLMECWHGISSSQLQVSCATVYEDDAIPSTTTTAAAATAADTSTTEDATTTIEDTNTNFESIGDYPGAHCMVVSGMETVLQPLIDNVVNNQQHSQIRLNDPVFRIEFMKDGDSEKGIDNSFIRLQTLSGYSVDTKYCVVTIPIGCLKNQLQLPQQQRQQQTTDDTERPSTSPHPPLSFVPSLSEDKLEAIDKISMGSYKKVFLTFDRIFWSPNEAFLGLIRKSNNNPDSGEENDDTDGLGNFLLMNNCWARNNIPCLEAILIGDAGMWSIGKSDEIIRLAVLKFMEQSMMTMRDDNENCGNLLLDDWCISCHVTRWEEDPMSNGAYCNFGIGTLERHMDALKEPEEEWNDRLFFAGDGTIADYLGSVHAAIISGQEVAAKILERIREN